MCRNLGAVADELIGQLEDVKDAGDVKDAEAEIISRVDSAHACNSDKGKGLESSGKLPPGKPGPTVGHTIDVQNNCSAVRRTTVNPSSSSVADRGAERASPEKKCTPSVDEVPGAPSPPSTRARPATPGAEGRRRVPEEGRFPAKRSALRVGAADGVDGGVSFGGGDVSPAVPETGFATAARRLSWMARMKQRIRSSSVDPSARRRSKVVTFAPSPVGVGWGRGLKRREGSIETRVLQAQEAYDSVTKAVRACPRLV